MFGDAWQDAFYAYFSQSIDMFRVPQDILTGENTADATNSVLMRCSDIIAFLNVDSLEDILCLMSGEYSGKLAIIRVSFVDAEILEALSAKNIPYLPQIGQPLSKYKTENDALHSIEKHVKRLLGVSYTKPFKKAHKTKLPIWVMQKPP
jgi:hypothetical protein